MKLKTKHVLTEEEVRSHFDRTAAQYREQHGRAERLLEYRLKVIKNAVHFPENGTVLEVGCGPGQHLLQLAPGIGRGIGVDFSPKMIEIARQQAQDSPWKEKLTFRTDEANTLATIPDQSIDVTLCVGAFEHMWDKPAVLSSIFRVLKSGGRFVLLTPNGNYLWYRMVAPRLGVEVKHFSSDEFLGQVELENLFIKTGFQLEFNAFWTFIPRGDMSPFWGGVFTFLDGIGRILGVPVLRGGIVITASKE